jgi:hypothetical protein
MRPASALPVRAAPVLAAALALAASLLLAPRTGAAPAARPATRPPRATLSTVPADLPAEMLGEKVSAIVTVRALVAPSGLVDSTRAEDGDERLRPSAEAAVRWWVFAPGRSREWVAVRVPFEADADAEPLYPDVIAIARQSESDGDLPTALAGWVGALARLGKSPVVRNEWTIREHTMAIAHRMPPIYPGGELEGTESAARGEQLRTVARSAHLDLLARFDHVLAGAPWWDEPYLWSACSYAGCGRGADALRSLRAYRLATTDSAGSAFAARMIDRLAVSDTTGVSAAIRTWRVVMEPEDR